MNIDRHIEQSEWLDEETASCTGQFDCTCPDCCADAAVAFMNEYIGRVRQ